jgi:hypothetical protein
MAIKIIKPSPLLGRTWEVECAGCEALLSFEYGDIRAELSPYEYEGYERDYCYFVKCPCCGNKNYINLSKIRENGR